MDEFSRRISLQTFEKNLNYKFKNISLLDEALTHASFSHEHKKSYNYERMEVLGDSLLGLIVIDYLFKNYRNMNEGEISKAKSFVVSEPVLARASTHLGVPEFIQIGRGEEQNGGRGRASMLADVFEAIVCAIYLDSGALDQAYDFVIHSLNEEIVKFTKLDHGVNYKSVLQEYSLKHYGVKPEYKLIRTLGPEHEKTFIMSVEINEAQLAVGFAKSRKEAEQMCAQSAYKTIIEFNSRPEPEPENVKKT